MSSRKKPLSDYDRESNQLLKEGAESLALDVEELLARNCDLLMEAAMHRMCQEGFTYAEAWADIGTAVLKAHTAKTLFRHAYEYREYIKAHTGDGDED